MTDKPHDALFKAAFERPEHAAGLFRCILPPTVNEAIAWETIARESGSFIAPDLADRHSDLLFSVELHQQRALLYLLLEHQSTHDIDMPLRMYLYSGRIFERYRKEHAGPLPSLIPVVLTHAPEGWKGPVSLADMIEPHPDTIPGLAALVPNISLLVFDLTHLDDDQLKRRALALFPMLALWALRDARDSAQLLRSFHVWLETLREAVQTPHGKVAIGQVLRYIALVTGDMHFQEFRETILREVPEAKEITMTIAEELREEGRAEGHEKGRREGHVELLTKLLTLKFGEMTASTRARLESATHEQLVRYGERILTAEALEDVFS